jgi:hypothetical protein
MKKTTFTVAVVLIYFTIAAAPALWADKTNQNYDQTVSASNPAKKHTIKKKSYTHRHKKAYKNKNSASMFKKSLFDDPALKPKQ